MPVPAQIPVLNASGVSVNVNAPLAPGRALAAESRPVALSNEDNTNLAAIAAAAADTTTASRVMVSDEYETVAASATDQVLGATGATGDRLTSFVIQPGTTSPGNVILKDGTTVIYTFPGGASSVLTLHPFCPFGGIKSVNGAFKVTTGANVTVMAIGDFT